MRLKSAILSFIVTFALTFVVTAVVNLLWNLIAHGESTIEWGVPIRMAIILGIVLTWMRSRG